jgi:hypothetical protein
MSSASTSDSCLKAILRNVLNRPTKKSLASSSSSITSRATLTDEESRQGLRDALPKGYDAKKAMDADARTNYHIAPS